MRFNTLAEWLAWQETLHPKSIDLGLSRVREVFEKMGLGERIPYTITVGGTNGKGSCVAMLDAILRNQGYRVGTYTSPHLLRYNERIRIDGAPVDDARISEAFTRIDAARGQATLSFFEFGTLAALSIFSESELDVQVLEVGLGGRLDAVNLIAADVALIASIAIDHQEFLGNTREAIGFEKAGIFRSGKPAVVGTPDAPLSVIRYADQNHVPLSVQGRDFGYEASAAGWTWYNRDARLAGLPFPALPGEHQLMNAASVLEALHRAGDRLPVAPVSIREGLSHFELAGRFQYIPGEVPLLLDVAHNPDAVRVLAEHLRRNFAERRIHAVFAVMRDKDIPGILNNIKNLIGQWYLAPLKMSRAATEEQLLEVFDALGVFSIHHGFPDAGSAFACARQHAQEGDLVLIFGSFFLVSEYLAHSA
jgi:dihydrofolate synthase/folylpolyglutamate synthase